MEYTFKFWKEMGWFAFVALVTYLVQIAATFNPESIATDWKSYLYGVVFGSLRAVAGAVMAKIQEQRRNNETFAP